ncbi:S9 family peptidase [Bacillus sp. es.034]|uniref:S9 family peptidase n=1 Tax=Bacillus sp. es.034 TaxID=1761763 RepID=UPI000C009747|nr:S9 family peptidase [Bacillus sp. es.034]PFG07117.1 dipeptidyl aminopeptidase/acylaminoacyl peptidase [Bacillus sp. es.034]
MKKSVTIKDLYEIKAVSDPRLSPGGEEAVFVQTVMCKEKDEYFSTLHSIDLKEESIRQWTFGEQRISSPRWSPDGRRIAFISNRSGVNQLYLISRDGGEAERVTDCPTAVSNPVWSPCGEKIALSIRLEKGGTFDHKEEKEEKPKPFVTTSMKYKSDDRGFHDDSYSQIAYMNIGTKEMKRLTDDEHDYTLHSWSPDGKYLAVSTDRKEDRDFSFQSDLYLFNLDTGESKQVNGEPGYYGEASWSPDGMRLAYIGHNREFENATHNKIYIHELETGHSVCLTEGMDVPVGDYLNSDSIQGSSRTGIQWSKDNESFYFLASDSGNTVLYYAHIEGAIYPALLQEEQHVYGFDLDSDRQTILLAMSRPTEPGELYTLHVPTGELTTITRLNGDLLAARELSSPESFMYNGANDWPVQGWIMKPAGFEEGKKYPLIVEIHGGPHTMYGNTFFHEFQVLTNSGYAVLYVNPRGSHGYGQDFVDAVRGDYGGGDYEDIMKAVDYALKEFPFIDESRLGVTGGSYGGFMTNWIIGHSDRFKAAVTQRSISNWISFYGVSDIGYYFSEWQIQSDLGDVETLWKHSPLAYVKNIDTPLLILHSEKDYRCPIEQAEQLFIALKRENQEARFVRFPESNHNLSRTGKPSMREARLQEIVNWFGEHL